MTPPSAETEQPKPTAICYRDDSREKTGLSRTQDSEQKISSARVEPIVSLNATNDPDRQHEGIQTVDSSHKTTQDRGEEDEGPGDSD